MADEVKMRTWKNVVVEFGVTQEWADTTEKLHRADIYDLPVVKMAEEITRLRSDLDIAVDGLRYLSCKTRIVETKRSHTEDCIRCSILAKLKGAEK